MFAVQEWINPVDEYWIIKFAAEFGIDIDTLCKFIYLTAQMKGEQGFDY